MSDQEPRRGDQELLRPQLDALDHPGDLAQLAAGEDTGGELSTRTLVQPVGQDFPDAMLRILDGRESDLHRHPLGQRPTGQAKERDGRSERRDRAGPTPCFTEHFHAPPSGCYKDCRIARGFPHDRPEVFETVAEPPAAGKRDRPGMRR